VSGLSRRYGKRIVGVRVCDVFLPVGSYFFEKRLSFCFSVCYNKKRIGAPHVRRIRVNYFSGGNIHEETYSIDLGFYNGRINGSFSHRLRIH